MALCPFAVHRLIAPGSSDPAIKARAAVLHVDAGGAASLFDYFLNRSGGVESHFHITWTGKIEQYRDTAFQADANYLANDFAISIETQGFGNGKWNKRQLAAIKRLLLWINATHPDVTLTRIPKWDGAGVGYHVQFGAPGPWTPFAKSCPGPYRIEQYDTDIVPWMVTVTSPPKPPKRVQLRITTANLWRENTHVAEDLAALAATRVHVAGLNEAANFIDEVLAVEGYQAVYGAANPRKVRRSHKQNPILLRNDLKVIDQGRIEVSKAVGHSPERTATWVTYDFKGQTRTHINTHFNSHVQAGAVTPHNLPRVLEYIRGVRKVRRLAAVFMQQGHRVTVSGDLNWGWTARLTQWRYSPKRQFAKIGLEAQFAHKTDLSRLKGDRRRIEYVFADDGDLILAGQRYVKGEHSDHPFHEVTYFVKGL